MKHKLLYALAGAMMMSMSAFAWDAPTRPSLPTFPQYEGTWVDPVNDGTYYIYNVGTGQFLGCGLDWGTRAVTTNAAIVALDDAQWNVGTNKNTIIPFQLHQTNLQEDMIEDETLEGTWQIFNLNTNKSSGDKYLCHEGNAAWIDGGVDRRNTDKNGFWTLSKAGDAYEMLPLDGQEGNSIVYGVHLPNLASAQTFYTWTDLHNNADASAKWKFVSSDDVESIRTYIAEVAASDYPAAFDAYKTAMNVYDAKVNLYNTLLEADKYGADATEAGAVYNNADATVDEINAANNALKELIKPLALAYGIAHSSEAEPFDLTSYVLTNPDFETGNINGWTVDQIGQNLGYQGANYSNTYTDEQGNEITSSINKFIEAWYPVNTGALKNGSIRQTINGLPAGRYRLAADVMAVRQDGTSKDQLTGLYLFYNNGAYTRHSEVPCATGDGLPEYFKFDFDFAGANTLTVGLMAENTNCNWMGMDNVKLFAIGPMQIDPTIQGLEDLINEAQEIADQLVGNNIEDESIINANNDSITSFRAALDNARVALRGGNSEVMKAAVESLGKAISAINNSAELYKKFQEVYNKAMLTAQELNQAGQWQELQDDITDWAEGDLTETFNAGNLTEADLEAAQNKVDELVAAFLNDPEMIKPGDDLTILVKNADFSQGSGRDLTGNAVPGWTITNGSLTELSPTYHNIEKYHGPIDIQQTIKNLPAGSYRIGVQGFVRIDGGENDMVLYAGVSEKHFMEITDEYSEYALLGDATDDEGNKTSSGAWPYDTPRGDGLGYQPNSMEGAKVFFEAINPMTDKPFYLNTVTIAHSGGDLTIGVKSNASNLWILWDNFTLTYLGKDALIPIIEEIQERGIELDELLNSGFATAATRTKASEVLARVEKSDDLSSSDEALALLEQVKQTIDEVKEGQAVASELMEAYENFSQKAEEAEIADESYLNLLDEVGTKMESEEFKSLEEMKDYITRLEKGFIPAIIATAEPGDDITAVLNNPNFDSGNANHWTLTGTETDDSGNPITIGQNQGFQNNATYSGTDEAGEEILISNFIEAWRPSTHLNNGTIAQTIAVALPEGYYRIKCDGYAVNQSAAGGLSVGELTGVYLWAQCGTNSRAESIVKQEENASPTHFALDFYSNGVDLTTVGILVENTNCNWVAVDNFELIYLGTTPPDAVEGIAAETNAAIKNIFTIDGRQTSTLRRGINIVRKADGTVQKVLVK